MAPVEQWQFSAVFSGATAGATRAGGGSWWLQSSGMGSSSLTSHSTALVALNAESAASSASKGERSGLVIAHHPEPRRGALLALLVAAKLFAFERIAVDLANLWYCSLSNAFGVVAFY